MFEKGARATEYELAIQWLMDAGLVHKVSRIKELQMPVKFYEKDLGAFKLFLLDCGSFRLYDRNARQPDVGRR